MLSVEPCPSEGAQKPPEMTDPPAEIPELPADRWIDRLVSLLEPVSRVTRPRLYGVEHLPADGSLLVGNHTIYGFLDLPFMMAEIWKHRRLAVRGLGEHAHYAVPIWRELLTVGGMVRGTRDNVRALMRERQTILVFPGGSREVNKRRPAVPTPVEGAHRLRAARDRAGLCDRPVRGRRRRRDARRDRRPEHADLRSLCALEFPRFGGQGD